MIGQRDCNMCTTQSKLLQPPLILCVCEGCPHIWSPYLMVTCNDSPLNIEIYKFEIYDFSAFLAGSASVTCSVMQIRITITGLTSASCLQKELRVVPKQPSSDILLLIAPKENVYVRRAWGGCGDLHSVVKVCPHSTRWSNITLLSTVITINPELRALFGVAYPSDKILCIFLFL